MKHNINQDIPDMDVYILYVDVSPISKSIEYSVCVTVHVIFSVIMYTVYIYMYVYYVTQLCAYCE